MGVAGCFLQFAVFGTVILGVFIEIESEKCIFEKNYRHCSPSAGVPLVYLKSENYLYIKDYLCEERGRWIFFKTIPPDLTGRATGTDTVIASTELDAPLCLECWYSS